MNDEAFMQGNRPVKSLAQMFLDQAAKKRNKPALFFKNKRNSYDSLSWREWLEQVRFAALGIHHLGARKQSKIAILAENSPEWVIADLGILSLGAVTVPIYPTLQEDDIEFILQNGEVEIVFVSGPEQYKKVKLIADKLQSLKWIVSFLPISEGGKNILSLSSVLEYGRKVSFNNPRYYEQNVSKIEREDIATIIYTSGTTGRPKGVALTHGNFLANIEGAMSYIPVSGSDLALSFLPLSHVFERLAGYYYMMAMGASIAYAENMQTVADDMKLARPTVAAAVPRFYEKIHEKILEKARANALRFRVFNWSVNVGRTFSRIKLSGDKAPFGLILSYGVANLLLFRKIRSAVGGRIRFFISGGAPLNKDLAEFFHACGVLILEGYGLTETSPVIAVNPCYFYRFGTVGLVLPNVELKIAEDGEIMVRGPSVMKEYFKNTAATEEVIKDGWFLTGDIGIMDEKGFLSITDRKKDIIVTSGGKNISPQNIERLILQDTLFAQAVVLGDGRNYLIALLVPNRSELEKKSRGLGLKAGTYKELLDVEGVVDFVEKRLKERLSPLPRYEQIKYFALMEKEFSIESGELTPTQKIKRRVVMKKYSGIIESLYQKGDSWKKN